MMSLRMDRRSQVMLTLDAGQKQHQKQIATVLFQLAKNDTCNDVGRLMLSDCRYEAGDKHLTIKDVIALWHKYYPTIEIEQATDNILLIYWSEKGALRKTMAPKIPQKAPSFKADNKYDGAAPENFDNPDEFQADKGIAIGEVTEDDTGVVEDKLTC